MWLGAEGGAGGGEGERSGPSRSRYRGPRRVSYRPLLGGWHRQPVPTPFCLGDGVHEARVAGSQARSAEGAWPSQAPCEGSTRAAHK